MELNRENVNNDILADLAARNENYQTLEDTINSNLDQPVKSTSSPTFAAIKLTSIGDGGFTETYLYHLDEALIPAGIYYVNLQIQKTSDTYGSAFIEIRVGGVWQPIARASVHSSADSGDIRNCSSLVISDGVNARVRNAGSGVGFNINYRLLKYS